MLISRNKEKKTLLDALQAEEAQFIAVYGRRRVGKTYLIRQTYDNMLTFEHSGLANGGRKEQLQAFAASIIRAGLKDGTYSGRIQAVITTNEWFTKL